MLVINLVPRALLYEALNNSVVGLKEHHVRHCLLNLGTFGAGRHLKEKAENACDKGDTDRQWSSLCRNRATFQANLTKWLETVKPNTNEVGEQCCPDTQRLSS